VQRLQESEGVWRVGADTAADATCVGEVQKVAG
jgi:hypothetical protein